MNDKLNDKLNLEWFIAQKNVFAFEINTEDFNFLKYRKGWVYDLDDRGAIPSIAGTPIRIKKDGDITIIYNDCCVCCGQEIKG